MKKVENLRTRVKERRETVETLENEFGEMNETIQSYLSLNDSKDVAKDDSTKPGNDRDCLVFHGVKVDNMELVAGINQPLEIKIISGRQ